MGCGEWFGSSEGETAADQGGPGEQFGFYLPCSLKAWRMEHRSGRRETG